MQVPASASAPLAPFATSTGATSAAPEDLGPLAWVVGEVQKSLESAGKLLRRFARESQGAPGLDVAGLRTARQQLHQTVGALQLVGHSAPALVLGAMEFAVQSFVEEPLRCTDAAVTKVERAGFAVVDFLQALLAGKSVSSVALFPQYREVLELVRNERVHPADLWSEPWRWVDISLPSRQPALVYDPAVRSKLDREVLKVIKGGDDVAARRLHELCLGLARGSAAPHVGSFWTLAAAFFEAISLALVPADVFVKRAASRVLLQYATLARNDSTVSDRLAQDLLFFCAQAVPSAVDQAQTLRAVRAAWKIEQHQAVDYTSEQFGRFDPVVLVQVRKRIDAAKEMWSALAGGDLTRLRQVADAFSQLGESLQKLHPPSSPMAQALSNAVDASLKSGQAPATELAMEVATSVLYLEAAFEDLDPHDRQLTARTVQLAGRIERAREGGRSEPLEPWMEELYRRVSDRQSMGTVVDELRSHLGELEKSLDQFFRRPAEKGLLRAVPSQLLQMRGVLSVLGLEQAAQAVQRMRDTVDRMLAGGEAADVQRDFDSLGNNLGALGFLVDMLGYQPALAKRLFVFDDAAGELKPLMGRQAAEAEADAKAEAAAQSEPKAAPSASVELAKPVHDPRADVASSSSAVPAARDATVLSTADIDAQIAARLAALGASSRPTASPIDEFSQAAESWNARINPPVPQERLPDTEVTELEEEDLQDIFLAEAREVLQGGLAAVATLAHQPGDNGELTVLRRAFHTLKGSSRMVGLTDFGEAAWALEQVLNTWLADQKPATPEFLSGTGQALRDFSTWVEAIASSEPHAWQAAPFQQLANALSTGEQVLSASGTEALAAAAREIAAEAAAETAAEAAAEPAQAAAAEPVPQTPPTPLIPIEDEATLWAGLDGGRSVESREDIFEPTDFLDFDGKAPPTETQPGALAGAEGIDFLGSGPAPVEPFAPAIPMPDEPTVWVGLDDRSPQQSDEGAFARHEALPADSAFEPTDFLDFNVKPTPEEQPSSTLAGAEGIDFFALAPTPEALEVPPQHEELIDLPIPTQVAEPTLPPMVDAPLAEVESPAEPEPEPEPAPVVEPTPEPAPEPVQEPEPVPEPVLEAEAEAVVEDAVKVIGPLRIGIALYNVYLNEADEWSRQLVTEVGEWALEPHVQVADSTVGLAHSLAGSSATVGFSSLSAMARSFEAALQHLQLRGGGTLEHGAVVVHAADELRRLLHQFAAGFLKEPDPATLRALRELAAAPLPAPPPVQEAPSVEVVAEVPPEPEPEPMPEPVALVAEPLQVPLPVLLAPPEPTVHDVVLEDSDEAMDLLDAVDAELFPIFEEEAAELLPQLGTALRTWVQHPDDPAPRASVLRTLHTLKGSARLAGAMRLGERAHRMESEIESIGSQYIDRAAVEQVMTRFDALQSTFDGLRAADSAAQAELAQCAVDAATAAAAAAAAPPVVEPTPVTSYDQPAVAPVAETAAPAPSAVAMPAPSMLAPLRPASNQAVRIRTQLLDRLVAQAGEVIITRSRLEAELGQLRSSLDDLTGNLDRLRQQLRDIEVQAESQMQSRLAQAKDSQQGFDPLEFDRFTRVQELTRMMAESVNDVATVQRTLQRTVQATEDDLSAQARQTRELQRGLLRTRMVEFEGISERLYRVVRQAGKDAGRQVRLDITGGTIEMDRGVLDRMTPAFEHLLRNSVAHGIEDADTRTRAGKDPSGLITIDLQHDGNDVSVSFRDDGGGLDEQRIAARARAMGLVNEGQWLSPEDAAEMIFRPGFSTADSVSELAGRGIGMDVVRSHVAALGGRIETRSVAGQGTTFKLVLPLTTAVTHVVMLRAGNTSVGVPSNLIELVQRAPGADVERAYQSQRYTFGGEQIPFFWMGALLQSSARSERAPGKTNTVVVVRSAAQRVAMHVDEVLGNQEVVVKNLGPQLSRLAGMAGITVLASGAVALIYNPVALAGVHGEQARALQDSGTTVAAVAGTSGDDGHVAPAARQAPSQVPLVLVVDDSITVRRVTQRLLQREGYRVSLAADGLQALERLQQERPAVVLSDIEMPRMDGFDLARNIRADQAMADLPIIMITSRIAEKHRDHAKQLGVNHYLGKPYSEDELMRLVRSYARADVPVALAA